MTTDPESPEVLMRVPSEVEAAAIVTALASRGIEALTTGGFTAGFRAEAPGQVSVMVHQDDLAPARQAITEIQQEAHDIDWSQVDVGKDEDE